MITFRLGNNRDKKVDKVDNKKVNGNKNMQLVILQLSTLFEMTGLRELLTFRQHTSNENGSLYFL